MSSSSRSKLSPPLAAGIVLLAVAVWGAILWQQTHHSPVQQHIDAGNEYARRGDGPNAVREWRAATDLDPNSVLAWQLLGQSFFEAHLWHQAKDALSHVAGLNPNTPHLNSLLASCSRNLGQTDDALKYGREELKRNPNDIPALETCAAVLTQMRENNTGEMIGDLRRLAQLEPNNVERSIALAQALIGENNAADVLPILDHILQLAPDNGEMYALRGFSRFFADGSPAGMKLAEADMKHALTLRPKLYVCYLYLGKICRRRGQWKQAASYLEEATRLNPKKSDPYYDLAAVYGQLHQRERAQAALQRFQAIARQRELYTHLKKRCQLDPNNFDLNLAAGKMALQQEELPEARKYLSTVQRLRPNDPRAAASQQQLAGLIDRMSGGPNRTPNAMLSRVGNTKPTGGP